MTDNSLFPFPIFPIPQDWSEFGAELAQAITQDLGENKSITGKKTVEYALAKPITAEEMEQYKQKCSLGSQVVEGKLNTVCAVMNYLLNVAHRAAFNEWRDDTADFVPRDVFVWRDADSKQARYLVVARENEKVLSFKAYGVNIATPCWYLFSDGVMLPADDIQWDWKNPPSYWQKVGLMHFSESRYTWTFENATQEQAFKQSPTLDDYFAAIGANSDLQRIKHFFVAGEYHNVTFETQETQDKFCALFPKVVKIARSATCRQVDKEYNFMHFISYFRPSIDALNGIEFRNFKMPQHPKLVDYAFGFALWYLLFRSTNHEMTHDKAMGKYQQAHLCQSRLISAITRWNYVQNYFEAAERALLLSQQLQNAGFVVNQSQFKHENGYTYLLTHFNPAAGLLVPNMELTQLLKNGQPSQAKNAKKYVALDKVQQGKSPFTPLTRPAAELIA
ncbi:hypothetical protein [Conchiformibius steedae]|uniref:hypothetical protein n=1 Tax=Conchiformibius steedae TaxID=153493 RepID=UPI0026F05D80|nr:hypothetical protein [Conchiformibius steedae]